MSTLQTVVRRTDGGKPILELKERQKFHWVGEEFQVLPHEEKTVERLEREFKIQVFSQPNKITISTEDSVGIIEFQNFILNVKPKFVKLQNLGRLLDFANDIESDQDLLDDVKFQEEFNHPIEFVIRSFLSSTQKLIHSGLYRSYVPHQEDVSFLRGKLILKQQLRNDVKFNMKFHCEFDEFTANNLENQTILYTLEQCKFLTKFQNQKKLIQRLIHQIDSQVEYKQISLKDFQKIAFTRLNSRYVKPHILAKMIIRNMGMQNLNRQSSPYIIPFFVTMYDVWEHFLENLFRDYYGAGTRIKKQDRHDAWLIHKVLHPIRPDIVIYKDGLISSVIDAKYMKKLEVGGKEMYQIAFYLSHLKLSVGYAVLPYEEEENYDVDVPLQNISIKVRYVPIDDFLDILYSKKSHNQIKLEVSSKLQELIPVEKLTQSKTQEQIK